MRIARATDEAALSAASSLMQRPTLPAAAKRFLENPSQHLLVVYDEEDRIAGCVFGFEVTHLDEGTEMFLHDLTVARGARRLGVATALVRALAGLALERGCYRMRAAVPPDNRAAIRTYRRTSAGEEELRVFVHWDQEEMVGLQTAVVPSIPAWLYEPVR